MLQNIYPHLANLKMTQTRAQRAGARADLSILYSASVSPGANQYYGQIAVTNLHNSDGSGVTVKEFLGVQFHSPCSVAPTDFFCTTIPYVEVSPEITNMQIDTKVFIITAKLYPKGGSHTFSTGDVFNWGINGDLTADPSSWTSSFYFTADALPDTSGTVNVSVAAAPDAALASVAQTVTLTQGQLIQTVSGLPGSTTPSSVMEGTYVATVVDLATADETTIAATQVSPTTVTVTMGQSTDMTVTYGAVSKCSAIDIVLGDVPELSGEQLHVTVKDGSNKVLADFYSLCGKTTSLRRLPPSGSAVVSIDTTTINNVAYSFAAQSLELSSKLFTVTFSQDNVHILDIDTTGFVKLPVVVSTDVSLASTVSLRLRSASGLYTQAVTAQAGTTNFGASVAPGTYTVSAPNFLASGTIYFVNGASSLTVAADGSTTLPLGIVKGANLNVRGFPSFLSFGGCADLTASNTADFVAARASSLFKYAGTDGAGDANTNLSDDQATRYTISTARSVEAQLNDGNPVLPVMISYTCNLSGANVATKLADTTGLANSFGNYILSLSIANSNIDASHAVPAGYVVNPDFIGACQQEGLSASYAMSVRAPLQTALDYRSVSATIPSTITDDIGGYVKAVNWLTRTVAPAVTFGWQVNLWGVGSSNWVYDSGDEPETSAAKTVEYVNSLGVFAADAAADFMAVDRYEADDFTVRSYANSYCYGPNEWPRFFRFCSALAQQLAVPIMPWQIPASHTPLVGDAVNDDFDLQHWGTGGTYMFGDAGLGSDYNNVNSKILDFEFPVSYPFMGATGADVFKRGVPFDWTNPAYATFPLQGIFAVLLGGGSTTGISSTVGDSTSWVRDKTSLYMTTGTISFNG